MAAIKRALLPPILKTVKSLTLSALGKVCRSLANELKSVCLTIRYQDSSAVEHSGCFLANSSKRFRVMMCIAERCYLILRYLSIKKYSDHYCETGERQRQTHSRAVYRFNFRGVRDDRQDQMGRVLCIMETVIRQVNAAVHNIS